MAWKAAISFIMSALLAAQPTLAHSSAARRVTPQDVLRLQNGALANTVVLTRYGGNSRALSEKAAKVLASVGREAGFTLVYDVLQGAIIMYMAAAAQLARDRIEKEELLAGQKLEYENVKKHTMKAAEDLFCQGPASVHKEILCSGEFWIGVAGGAAVRIGTQFTALQALNFLLKSNPSRAVLIQTIGTMAASFLMVGGFIMTGQLWTQAANVAALQNGAINKTRLEMAHGLFGRAVEKWLSGEWHAFKQTEEGRLAAEIFQNMRNILLVDPELRNTWLYNGWRFGVARGELIVNLGLLIAAMNVGSSAGAAAATAAGLSSVSIWAASLFVATAFGAGISYASIYFPDLEIGARLTELIQNARAWMASQSHAITDYHLGVTAQAFSLDRRFQPGYRTPWETRFRRILPMLRKNRENWANVAVEKYFELSQKVDDAETTVELIRHVIQKSEFRDALTVNENGEILTLKSAREKFCRSSNCEIPHETQLRKLEKAKAIINEGKSVLAQMSGQVLGFYNRDIDHLTSLRNDVNLQFPAPLASLLKTEIEVAETARDVLSIQYAALHPEIRDQYGMHFDSEEQQKAIQLGARSFFDHVYTMGINEHQIALALFGRLAMEGDGQ